MARIKGTESETRRHVFIPFSERVASIKIDPIRATKEKRHISDEEAHFPAALQHWRELNLATNFTEFGDRAWPLARTLPLLLHNQEQVFSLLSSGIESLDIYSAEPLLDLLTQFAYDLGSEFETYFARSLTLLMDAVAKFTAAVDAGDQKQSIETVERIFNCLAYLFKYLSRLLVTDLRPTYNFLAPLFGRDQKQRGYVMRFAAESMSFLIRKCQGESLTLIIDHIIKETAAGSAQYTIATSMLLVNTLKGPGTTLHSRTPAIIEVLLEKATKYLARRSIEMCANVVAGGLHHARQDTAQPLINAVLDCVPKIIGENQDLAFMLLAVVAGLRKGDRVMNWQPIWTCYFNALDSCNSQVSLYGGYAGALLFGRSDFGTTTKVYDQFLNRFLKSSSLTPSFMALLSTVADLETEPFLTFAAQKTILATRSDLESPSAAVYLNKALPLLPRSRAIPPPKSRTKLQLPKTPSELIGFWWKSRSFGEIIEPLTTKDLLLIAKVIAACKSYEEIVTGSAVLTTAFGQFEGSKTEASSIIKCVLKLGNLSAIVRAPFLDALRDLSAKAEVDASTHNKLMAVATEFASHWHLPIRKSAMNLAASLTTDQELKSLFDSAVAVDEVQHDTTGARALALAVRNLMAKYSECAVETSEIVCHFLFGLSSSRFQPAWQAGVEALPLAASRHPDALWMLAESWIINPPRAPVSSGFFAGELEHPDLNVPECVYLEKARNVFLSNWAQLENPVQYLQQQLASWASIDDIDALRYAAIRAISTAPSLAEKHGDVLTPYLLAPGDEDDSIVSFSDRLALLELFAKFERPKRLAQWTEIRAQYEYFLGSRHLPLQKLAIKCILSANDNVAQSLRRYRSNLDALTDEHRFKDEVTTILAPNTEESGEEHGIHERDRQAVMPTILRLLYGRAQTARSKTGSEKSGQRHAVLVALGTHCGVDEREFFLSLATERAEGGAARVQQGMLSLLLDYVHEIKSKCSDNLEVLVKAAISASHAISTGTAEEQAVKVVRQNSLKLITELLVANTKSPSWPVLFEPIYTSLISPRLEKLGYQNREQVSAILQLISTLCEHPEFSSQVEYDNGAIIDALGKCLNEDGIKPPVMSLVLKSFANLIKNDVLAHLPSFGRLLVSRLPFFLDNLQTQQLQEAITLLNGLIEKDCAASSDKDTNDLVRVMLAAFEQTNTRSIPVSTRAEMLVVLSKLLVRKSIDDSVIMEAYRSLSRLFRQLSDRSARLGLSQIFAAFGVKIPALSRVGQLVVELNAFDARRIDTPDFDRRLAAFSEINENLYTSLSPEEWVPILQNMLFFIKDPEELALRNNAVYTLKRFIDAGAPGSSLAEIVLPAIRLGAREPREPIRKLYVEVLAHTVTSLDHQRLGDAATLVHLTARAGEEETDFFYNIFHIQQHRRRRALRRLAKIATEENCLESAGLAHFILPLIEHCAALANSKDSEKNALGEEALDAIAAITPLLTWSQYRAVAKRYITQVQTKPLEVKKSTRLVTCIAKALENCSKTGKMANSAQIESFVLNEAITPLHHVMAAPRNDDQNLPDRVGLALPIVWFIRALQPEKIQTILPGKLLWLCQLFRSKSQELRDLARSTLAKVSAILGTEYMRFILVELRSALRRGAQTHVLGFTVHSLLVEARSRLTPGDLNGAAPLITDVVLEEIFGRVGDEKDAEGYISGSREVKQNKSFDTAEILSSNLSLSQFRLLLGPIEDVLLNQRLDSKREKKATELFRRIALGLRANKDFLTQDCLVMAYQVFENVEKKQNTAREAARLRASEESALGLDGTGHGAAESRKAALDAAKQASEDFFTVRLSSRHWEQRKHSVDRYIEQLHLVQAFALETLQIALASGSGDGKGLLTKENATGLLPLLAKAALSRHASVQAAALRLAATVIKAVPAGEKGDQVALDLATRTLEIASNTPDTSSPIFQSALKTLSALLKSRSDCISDSAIEYMLDRVMADIEEPDKQGSSLGFIRAVLMRQVMLPQVYDTLGRVREVMITNANTATRAACRAAYLQFLTEYPHSKKRFERQVEYLVSQMQYPGSAGRQSVLELLTVLLRKAGGEQLGKQLEAVMVASVLTYANEEDEQCRSQCMKLTESLLSSAKTLPERAKSIIELYKGWLQNSTTNDALARAVIQIALIDRGYVYNGSDSSSSTTEPTNLFTALNGQLEELVLTSTQRAARNAADDAPWQLLYLSLQYIEAISKTNGLTEKQISAVDNALLFPHAWVRAAASRAIGHHFALLAARNSTEKDPAELLVHKFVRQLGAPRLSEADSLQIVKNVVFVVRRWPKDATITTRDEARPAIQWLAHKLSALVRAEWSYSDGGEEAASGSKTAAVQMLAALPQIVSTEQLIEISNEALGALYMLSESEKHAVLATEAMSLYEKAMGVTEYLQKYSQARQAILAKRNQRRTKRALEAVQNPELRGEKRLRKHAKSQRSAKRKREFA